MNRRLWMAVTGVGAPLAAIALITCVGDDPPAPGGGLDPAACAGRTTDEARAVFVNINGANSPQCGGASSPCQTIQAGIDQAKVLGRSIVYVARGTYKESIKLAAGLTLEGGWDTLTGKWIPACGNETVSAVKVQMPDSANVVATADFTGTATLRFLSIVGKSSAAPAESVYGVLAKDATLTFEVVSVSVGNAGAGGEGAAGATGATGGTKCATGTGAAGTAGATGAGAGAGAFGANGYTPSNGGNGESNGTKGANGTCTANCGGSERTSCVPNTPSCSATQGCVKPLAGCGGSPGTGGGGGNGGGSSIALLGWNATFNVSGGAFISGNGGNGGAGGKGGDGGKGGAGTTEQTLCMSCTTGNNCATVGNQTIAAGATGGEGGAGGVGGGGAGGSSYSIYAGGPQGKLNVASAPLYQHGTPGSNGAPNGAAGAAAETFP
jgi:hypothetical protein